MKQLFAIIMSLNLILVPVAFGQGSGDQYRQGSTSSHSTVSYMKQILGLGIGVIGSNILTTCKMGTMQPSVLLFMAGSLAMIGSEIAAGKNQSKLHDAKTKDLEMIKEKMKMEGEGGDIQKGILETALKEEKETQSFIKKRRNWMTAISVVFMASTVLSILEFWWSFPPPVGTGKTDSAACTSNGGITSKLLAMAITMSWSWGAGKVGGGPISQYGGMLLTLLPQVTSLDSVMSVAYGSAIPRAITFGVSTGISGWITVDLAKKYNVVSENVKKMESVVSQFKKETETDAGIEKGAPTSEDPDKVAGGKKPVYEVNKLANGSKVKDCFSNSSNGVDYSPAGCSNPLKILPIKFGANFNNSSLTAVSNLTTDMAQLISNGDIDGASIKADEIAGYAARIKDIKDKVEKDLNTMLKANGKPTIDIDKEVAASSAAMEADYMKRNNISGSTASPQVANPSSTSDKDSNPSPDLKITSATAAALVTPESVPMPSFSDEISTEESETVSNSDSSSNTTLNDYESTAEDISKKPDVSIFKQVSNRYILNYTKIFERKKAPEVETEPAKN